MIRRYPALFLVFVAVAPAQAEAPPPERLLPATTQVYFRWDGVPAHRERYAQVTIGKLLGGDLAPLLKVMLEFFPRSLQQEYVDGKLLDGALPDKLARMQADVSRASKIPELLARHGVILAAEIGPMPSPWAMAIGAAKQATGKGGDANPLVPKVTVMLIVPDAARDAATFMSMVRLHAASQESEIKEETINGRTVLTVPYGPEVTLMGWDDFGHVVLALTNETAEVVVPRATANGPRLADNPHFQRVSAFKEFATDVRGFVDLKGMFKTGKQALNLANLFASGISKKVDEFGVESFEGLTYWCGFDGPTRREVADLELAGERKGVARLFGGAGLTWDLLPPMPPDVGKWSAHRIDPGLTYDYVLRYLDLFRTGDDDSDPAAEAIDKAAGIAVKSDLIDQLGDVAVTYHSPSEGAVTLGQVLAIKVKDGNRVEAALDQIVQAQTGAATLKFKKRPYLDAAIREIQVQNKPGFIVLPSYVVYKGWLVVSLYPQPLQGFVQRAAGESKPWEPDETSKTRFAQLPKNCSTWAYNDPRPGAQLVLTLSPLILEAMQAFDPNSSFDVGTLPSGSTISQKLTPNVTGVTDNGKRVRWDSRGGLLLLGDSIGVDPMMLILAAQILN